MSLNQKNQNDSIASAKKWNRLLLLPIILSIAILPLLMSEYTYDSKLTKYTMFGSETTSIDFFLHCKQNFLIAMGVIMLFIIVCRLCMDYKKLRIVPIFIPLFIYGLMTFISTIASEYKSFSISGSYEQFQNIFALLTYCVIVYYIFITIKFESDVKFLLHGLIISACVLSILGLTQILGHDFLRTTFGLKLYVNKANWNDLSSYTFNFEPKRVYLTLYNPNYVGVYSALIMPLLAVLIYLSKNIKATILYLFTFFGMGICLIGSKSSSSILSIIVSFLFLILLLRKQIVKNLRITIPAIVCLVGLIVVCSIPASPFYMLDKLTTRASSACNYSLESVSNNENGAFFVYNGNTLQVQMSINDTGEFALYFFDGDQTPITDYTTDESSVYHITDPRYPNFTATGVQFDQLLGFQVMIDNKQWYFSNQLGDGKYYYINMFGKVDDIVPSKSVLFTDHPSFATYRGYLWSQTIPLLKDYIFVGSGPDTFVFDFPYRNYVARYNNDYHTRIVTKPHSWYLQMGTETGVLSLIAILVFYIIYFVNSMRIYMKCKFENYFEIAGVAIFIASISYMINGIANDSSICVAPVFWGLMGIGIAINFKLLKRPSTVE